MTPTRRQPLSRSDLLPICNDQKVALDDFKAAFCDRCQQPECTRSRTGGSRFERRVANWHHDLFIAPARMDSQDPRYATLAGKKFLTIDTGPTPEVRMSSSWLDPRDLTEGGPPSGFKPVTQPDPVFMTPLPREIDERPAPRQQIPGRLTPMNTPVSGPRMLANAPPQGPKKDAWEGPTPTNTSTEAVVAPGAKVRTKGSGSSGV